MIIFWLVLLRIVMEVYSKYFVTFLLPSIKKSWLFEIWSLFTYEILIVCEVFMVLQKARW